MAQKVNISGSVFCIDSTETIPFTAIVLSKEDIYTNTAVADIDGKYRMDSFSAGSYEIKVKVVGYKPLTDSLIINPADTLQTRNFYLQPKENNKGELHFLPYFKKPVIKKKKTGPL